MKVRRFLSLVAAAAAIPSFVQGQSTTQAATAPLPVVQAQAADGLVDSFGVATHLGYPGTPYDNVGAVKTALQLLGVRHVRDNLVSGKPQLYAAMRNVASTGVRFDVIMGNPITWDNPARLVQTLADNIPTGVVESLEGANEWNLTGRSNWAAELRSHQQALWTAAKANPVTRGLPVLAPALGMRSGYSELGNLGAWSDFGNAHLYPGGQKPSTLIDAVTAGERLVVPGKPVIFTEGGYHNAANTTATHAYTPESVAGLYAPKQLLEHYLRGTKRFYTYELVDERPDAEKTDHEANFGLLRNNWTPKPAYLSLQKLLGVVRDPGAAFTPGSLAYRIDNAPSDLRQLLLQKRDGTFVLLLWRDVSSYDRNTGTALDVAPKTVNVVLSRTSKVTVSQPTAPTVAPFTVYASNGPIDVGAGIVALQIR